MMQRLIDVDKYEKFEITCELAAYYITLVQPYLRLAIDNNADKKEMLSQINEQFDVFSGINSDLIKLLIDLEFLSSIRIEKSKDDNVIKFKKK